MSSNVGGSRRSFYYTMNYDDDDVDADDMASPGRNQNCISKSSVIVKQNSVTEFVIIFDEK
jgi:hypothetical protein